MVQSSFLRWAGSKRRLLPKLRAFWCDEFERYVEPFMGSACLFFDIKPKAALLGDINEELVATFGAVRDHPRAVYNAVHSIPSGKVSYYRVRSQDGSRMPEVQRAARFIFLNRFCFNGLYRTNQRGQFNVPFACSRNGHLPTSEELIAASRTLRTADVRKADFADVLRDTRAGDFVYLDPPYAVTNRRMFRQYGPDCFGIDDLHRLQRSLKAMDKRGVRFVVSYALCKEALEVLQGWRVTRAYTLRNISGFAQHRRKAAEILISNCEPRQKVEGAQ